MPKIVVRDVFRLSVNNSTIKLQIKLFSWLHYYSLLALSPQISTMGITSRCVGDESNSHCLFLDYDDCMYSVVKRDVELCQKNYDMGTAVILRSGEADYNIAGDEYSNYHAIFAQKGSFAEVCEIVGNTHADENFRLVPIRFNYRTYVLRIFPKYSEDGRMLKDIPKLREVVFAETGRETNLAMYEFLRKYYDVPEWTGRYAPNLDMLTELGIIHYNTTMGWNRTFMLKLKSLLSNIKMHMRGVNR